MKPSVCGAIVIFNRKWHNRTVIRAIPTDKTIPDDTIKWLMAYAQRHKTPLLLSVFVFEGDNYVGEKLAGYGPPSFTHAVNTEIWPDDVLMF